MLVWCGRRPSPKFCSTAEDLNSTPVFTRRLSLGAVGETRRLRQPSSSMMVGQVTEIRRNGAVVKVREDSADKVFIPGWQRQLTSSTGTWLSTMSGECIGLGDLVAYYVDTQEARPGFAAVGKNVMVLKESQEVTEKTRRRRQSTERSAGARYEVGDIQERTKRRNKKKVADSSVSEDDQDTDSEEDVTDGELEWLEKDLETILTKEDPTTKYWSLLKKTQSQLHATRTSKKGSLKKSGIKKLRGGYTPMKASSDDFWRMRRLLARVGQGYNSDSDPDYNTGDEVELVGVLARPGTADTENDTNTSFAASTVASSVHNRYLTVTVRTKY